MTCKNRPKQVDHQGCRSASHPASQFMDVTTLTTDGREQHGGRRGPSQSSPRAGLHSTQLLLALLASLWSTFTSRPLLNCTGVYIPCNVLVAVVDGGGGLIGDRKRGPRLSSFKLPPPPPRMQVPCAPCAPKPPAGRYLVESLFPLTRQEVRRPGASSSIDYGNPWDMGDRPGLGPCQKTPPYIIAQESPAGHVIPSRLAILDPGPKLPSLCLSTHIYLLPCRDEALIYRPSHPIFVSAVLSVKRPKHRRVRSSNTTANICFILLSLFQLAGFCFLSHPSKCSVVTNILFIITY